jgi:hypothetical protein
MTLEPAVGESHLIYKFTDNTTALLKHAFSSLRWTYLSERTYKNTICNKELLVLTNVSCASYTASLKKMGG